VERHVSSYANLRACSGNQGDFLERKESYEGTKEPKNK
jgi:hypothetical protein